MSEESGAKREEAKLRAQAESGGRTAAKPEGGIASGVQSGGAAPAAGSGGPGQGVSGMSGNRTNDSEPDGGNAG